MKSKHKKHLSLDRETVRTLSRDELTRVDGGKLFTIPGISDTSCSCNSCISCSCYCPVSQGHC